MAEQIDISQQATETAQPAVVAEIPAVAVETPAVVATETPAQPDVPGIEISQLDGFADKGSLLERLGVVEADKTTVNLDTVIDLSGAAEPAVAPTEPAIVSDPAQVDILPELAKKYGREIDEDYLQTDWRQKATEQELFVKEMKEKAESLKHIFENQDLMTIADLMKQGKKPIDILEAMSINPAEIPVENKIYDYIKREHPYLKTEDDIALFANKQFGIGEELDSIKEYDAERYFAIKKNLEVAISAQDKFLNDQKVQLLNNPVQVEPAQQQQPIISDEDVQKYRDTLNQHIESLSELKLDEEFSQPVQKDLLKSLSENIAYSGNVDGENVIILKNVKDSDLLEAMYLHKNRTSVLTEFKKSFEKKVAEQKSIEAFRKTDSLYNHVGGNGQAINTDTVPTIEIKTISGGRVGGGL